MPMNHSKMTDEWIAAALEANPIHIAPNGNVITCPVRLHFTGIFETLKPMQGEDATTKEPKYGCTPLFPPAALASVERIIKPKLMQLAKVVFPDKVTPEGDVVGIRFPFRRQDEKLDQQGFTPGGLFLNTTSKFQPSVYDKAHNEIKDPSRIYDGVWAILALNLYSYPNPTNRGVGLGLQSVMIFADDQKLLSKKADPRVTFAGVKKIDAAYNVDSAFGNEPVRTGHRPDAAETTRNLW